MDSVNLTNRFHVAEHLFSKRSQMTSKCSKNKKVAHEVQPSVSLMFLPHFSVENALLMTCHFDDVNPVLKKSPGLQTGQSVLYSRFV